MTVSASEELKAKIFRRERRKQTVPSALVGVFRGHNHIPCPTGGPMTAGMERLARR